MAPVTGKEWLAAACVALCAALLYVPSARNGYVFDDNVIVRDNPVVREMQATRALCGPYWPEPEGHAPRAPNWRPFAMISFVAERWIAGPGVAAVHHAGNALLHGLAVLALFPLARRIAARWAIAAIALFAAHPAHAESVAPVVGRCDLIAAIGALAALECFMRYRDGAKAWWLALGAAAYAIGLGGKESAAPVILLLPAADLLLRGRPLREIAGRGALAYVPYAAVAVLYLAARWAVLGDASFHHAGEIERGMGDRLLAAARNGVVTLGLLVVPLRFHHTLSSLPVSAPFDYPDPTGAAAVAFAAGGLVIGLGWIGLLRLAPRAAFVWLGAIATWGPTSGILAAAAGVSMRFLLLPSAFLACGLGLAMGSATRARPWLVPWLAVASALLVLGGAWAGWTRSGQWHDDGTFYQAILAEAPECYAAHQSLGTWYAGRRPPDMERARAHYDRAIRVAGDSDWGVQSQLDLATTFDAAEAERRCREIIERHPMQPRPHHYLAAILRDRGRRAEALEHERRAKELENLTIPAGAPANQ